ncbi:DeoR/GlpR family DNA-binding transcription regulator [Pelagibacterium sp. H642]|uniref:DeoR/GlpR family DNA-binding transcription regulator n=1 Tax=Pelagibacterium sp. H642 TaxID=1881069 RepID=UPI00281581B9|nr:DeoR/GlpR family DNA-binding transcription regulator [Pelagibacterium sp. H642]WMT92548.1 DeoR/GlpR family DNA-binding transcription regulator [Pelagibacterium sp. H642]
MRQQAIVEMITEGAGAAISTIAATCDVSEETVRRDLLQLEKDGVIRRVYGGAIPADRKAPIAERLASGHREKEAIARLVSKIVTADQWVFITGGSTTIAIAQQLRNGPPLKVMTNMHAIAEALQGGEHKVILTGGEYVASSGCMAGAEVIAAIAQCTFDLSIVGIYGFDPDHGLVELDRYHQDLKRTLIEHSRETVFVGDNTKFGALGRYCSVPLSKIKTIVSDRRPMGRVADVLEHAGVSILTPDERGGPVHLKEVRS